MKPNLSLLVYSIILLSLVATGFGIFSEEGPGPYEYKSIRGANVKIYGKGLYKDMSAEVAPQGIAQDYVTMFIGIPLLIAGLMGHKRESITGKYLFTGTLGYFLVTYLFYTVMGMYNELFLVYVALAGLSFYAFIISILSFEINKLSEFFKPSAPLKLTGNFLIFNSLAIAFLWLSIVATPLLNGTVIPVQVEHYTTLIVQGLDLAILLPAAFISGVLLKQRKPLGFLLAPIYLVFLSILMTALTAKIIAMRNLGYNVIPVIFIIPAINIFSIYCTVRLLKSINQPGHEESKRWNCL